MGSACLIELELEECSPERVRKRTRQRLDKFLDVDVVNLIYYKSPANDAKNGPAKGYEIKLKSMTLEKITTRYIKRVIPKIENTQCVFIEHGESYMKLTDENLEKLKIRILCELCIHDSIKSSKDAEIQLVFWIRT